jgi:hypothetical protein
MPPILIIRSAFPRQKLREYVLGDRGFVKAVVDCEKKIMAVGGALHADCEQKLLEEGSSQENLWGINMYPQEDAENWIEFDSMINIRPQQGNRTRGVESPTMQKQILKVVSLLLQ